MKPIAPTNPADLVVYHALQYQNARARLALSNHLLEVYRLVNDISPEGLAPALDLAKQMADEVLSTQRSIDAVHALVDQPSPSARSEPHVDERTSGGSLVGQRLG